MDGSDPNHPGATTSIAVTVLSITPVRVGKLFALAAVEIDIDGIVIEIRGIRALHVPPAATRIELPQFRDAAGQPKSAVILPEDLRGSIGDAVLDQLVELGLAVRRGSATTLLPSAGSAASAPA